MFSSPQWLILPNTARSVCSTVCRAVLRNNKIPVLYYIIFILMLKELMTLLGPWGEVAETAGVKLGELLNDIIDDIFPEDENHAE